MNTLVTIVLSLIAIVAALVFVLSTLCAFNGGASDRGPFTLCALVALAVVIVTMRGIRKLNKKT